MAWIYCSVRRAHITLQTLWFTTCVQRVIEAPHTHRVNICQTFQFCTTINAHFNLIRMTCDDIQICVFFRWGFMLCTPHCLSQTFAFSRIWIEFLWIYQQSTVSVRSAHFGALASMWEVLVGKHWDLQPRLPCLLPVQPGLFKICACGSFYYFDLFAQANWCIDIYTFWNHYSHCNEYALGTRQVRKKRKRE